jgi:hypothetical protein
LQRAPRMRSKIILELLRHILVSLREQENERHVRG